MDDTGYQFPEGETEEEKIQFAYEAGIRKAVEILSECIYCDDCPVYKDCEPTKKNWTCCNQLIEFIERS